MQSEEVCQRAHSQKSRSHTHMKGQKRKKGESKGSELKNLNSLVDVYSPHHSSEDKVERSAQFGHSAFIARFHSSFLFFPRFFFFASTQK